jgi:CRISPR-associated protein Cas2
MLTWVIYDISDDKQRTKAAKHCLRSGLYRVQKSVFLGDLNSNLVDQLALQLEQTMDPDIDRIFVFPVCKTDFHQARLLGQAFDEKLVTDELSALLM